MSDSKFKIPNNPLPISYHNSEQPAHITADLCIVATSETAFHLTPKNIHTFTKIFTWHRMACENSRNNLQSSESTNRGKELWAVLMGKDYLVILQG